ncbi:MAG: ribbon-helix-helix domain-containing protein [Candidatus Nanohaloarchaea archaeon]
MDTLVDKKSLVNEWSSEEDDNGEKTEERYRACNISVRPSTLDRIDRAWEEHSEYSNRSEFLRNLILKRVAEIEEGSD